ncbi:MAG: glycosyltransferase family 1 protein, partial [Sideroxyarcus sp.]|nr:glycosyltransferase family 1 protein [Sideroxyarcus sp.]
AINGDTGAMRIGIDARFYGPIGKGLGRYTAKLIEHLAETADAHAYRIYLRRENFSDYTPPDARITKVLAPYSWYSFEEQIRFPLQLLREPIDLMHFPHFNVPLLYRRPFIVTIHDLILTRFPTRRATTLGSVAYAAKRKAYDVAIRSALHRAKHILTVSQYSKQQIQNHFPEVPPAKIIVTYEGVDDLATRSDAALPEKYPERYFLYVGNAYPHKNLERLLEAFALFAKSTQDVSLVLVGKPDYFYDRLEQHAKKLGIAGKVVFAGYVDDKTLAALYQHAISYVIPSLEEGFGLPPLEAMQYKTPVISSRASCMPEILGKGAVYFDPLNIQDIANSMQHILEDDRLRNDVVTRGSTEVLPRYSWKKMAKETKALYTNT